MEPTQVGSAIAAVQILKKMQLLRAMTVTDVVL